MAYICPSCAKPINIAQEKVEAHEGATLDCPNCDTLLIIKDARLLEFHPYLHEKTKGEWPKDGKNTGYIEL